MRGIALEVSITMKPLTKYNSTITNIEQHGTFRERISEHSFYIGKGPIIEPYTIIVVNTV